MAATVMTYGMLLQKSMHQVFAHLWREVRAFEREDPDACYDNVVHHWVLHNMPGYKGGIEITEVPDPDIVMRHSMDLPNEAKQFIETLADNVEERNRERGRAFRNAAYDVLARHQMGEDVGVLVLTFAELVAGCEHLPERAKHHLIGLLYTRMRQTSVKINREIPYLFFIPSCMIDDLPRPVEVVDVPDVDHVKRHVLDGIRKGMINLPHILKSQKQ